MSRRLIFVLAMGLGLAACVTPAPKPPTVTSNTWVLASQEQRDTEFVWKTLSPPLDKEACRAELRRHTDRPNAPVGLMGWYAIPGRFKFWEGCIPSDLDMYERR